MEPNLYEAIQATAGFLRDRLGPKAPDVALVLGSGLGEFAARLADPITIPYGSIPGFPESRVEGHAGELVAGSVGEALGRKDKPALKVIAMRGRVHAYEGHAQDRVVFPLRTLIALGAKTVLLTNAAGGVNSTYAPGELVLIRDHLNLTGQNPLQGANDARLGPRFPDLSRAYDADLRRVAQGAASALGMKPLHEGVYAWLLGPTYETPAEIRMVRTLGADLVGMSTVPETIAASHMGARVLAISCVTNLAAGIGDAPLSHAEVMETANRVRAQFVALLGAILADLDLGEVPR